MPDDYPRMIAPTDHIEPAPRRVRAILGGRTVLDTTDAVDEAHTQKLSRGTARTFGLRGPAGVTLDGVARPRPKTHFFR